MKIFRNQEDIKIINGELNAQNNPSEANQYEPEMEEKIYKVRIPNNKNHLEPNNLKKKSHHYKG